MDKPVHTLILVVGALAVGVTLGGSLGQRTQTASPGSVDPEPVGAHAPDAERDAGVVRPASDRTRPQEPSASESERAAVTELALIHDGLIEFASAGIARGWAAVRSDGVPAPQLATGLERFEETILKAPEAIGRDLGSEQTRKERAEHDARFGGAMTLLTTLREDGGGPMPELVGDAERFEALFQRETGERVVSGNAWLDRPELLGDGVTLSFPAGVFELDDLMDNVDSFPSDVTIAGAGRDATLLLLRNLSTHGELRNFALRDCTVYSSRFYLFDLRREPSTMRFSRVRILGFDLGAGSSCIVGSKGSALLFRDCIIAGGYGRSPDSGCLIDIRNDGALLRFVNCRLDRFHLHRYRFRAGTTIVFQNCALTDVLDSPEHVEDGKGSVRFPGTSITYRDPSAEPPPTPDLNDLFPNWANRVESR